jgi:hypothetical protein
MILSRQNPLLQKIVSELLTLWKPPFLRIAMLPATTSSMIHLSMDDQQQRTACGVPTLSNPVFALCKTRSTAQYLLYGNPEALHSTRRKHNSNLCHLQYQSSRTSADLPIPTIEPRGDPRIAGAVEWLVFSTPCQLENNLRCKLRRSCPGISSTCGLGICCTC